MDNCDKGHQNYCNVSKSNMEGKRFHYLDVAKGILILLLIVSHYGSAVSRIRIDSPYNKYMSLWIPVFTTFFMQCFFIISGYCSNWEKTIKKFYSGLLRQLIIPYIVFQFIICVLRMVMHNDFSLERFLSPISSVPYTTLWFLIALFISKIVVFHLKVNKISERIILLLTFVLLVIAIIISQFNVGINVLCYQNALASCFFVAFGSYLRTHEEMYSKLLKYCCYIYPISFSFLMIAHVFYNYHTPRITADIEVSLFSLPIFVILSVSGSLAFIKLCKFIDCNSILEYFGRNSLIVYGLHFPSLYLLIKTFWNIIDPSSILEFSLFIFIVYTIEVIVCILWIQLLNLRYFRWIIGKRF